MYSHNNKQENNSKRIVFTNVFVIFVFIAIRLKYEYRKIAIRV